MLAASSVLCNQRMKLPFRHAKRLLSGRRRSFVADANLRPARTAMQLSLAVMDCSTLMYASRVLQVKRANVSSRSRPHRVPHLG